ncbi:MULTISPECIES: transporter substrate-binding domain-containing protein [Azospirillum]|uniref:Transporter substrate-binding protein n=1 Tax=Azospirillum lipoferum TaxID=193 RepID=A0A5A9GRL8_AZOLI|nr:MULTISPECIES: transporter substrate-binding domain-containing protein [Azospirillum]KAA0595959.1 transporter substrate-binding protein [Azospirillum lipoferum]MDW5533996.1 transporter substrate-binding domain-containing protein [Azospirillum sp. NL1]
MRRGGSSELTWRIGLLFSQSGVTADIERTQLHGTLLAIEEINAAGGVGGRPIEPIAFDPASDPARFRALAGRLLNEEQVEVIAGCYMSSSRKAVLPLLERRNGLLLYPTLYEGFECSRNAIYTGAAPNQSGRQLVEYLVEHYGARVYMVGSDYIFPHEANRNMRDLIAKRAGQILAEKYVPLDASLDDFTTIMRDIHRKQPDVVFSTVVGQATAHLYHAYAEAGFDPGRMPIASLTTTEVEIDAMGVASAVGHLTAAPYFESLDGEANRRFTASYRHRFGGGERTNASCEAAYFQMHLLAQALLRTGCMDTERIRAALLGLEYDAPQGRVRIDPDNHHTYLWPRVGRVGADGRFEIVASADVPVKPDPYRVDHDVSGAMEKPNPWPAEA